MPSGTRTVPMGEQTATLAANIRAEMGRRKMSQSDLATAVGMSQPGISKRLGGTVPWTFPELIAVAQVFDVPLALLTGEVAA